MLEGWCPDRYVSDGESPSSTPELTGEGALGVGGPAARYGPVDDVRYDPDLENRRRRTPSRSKQGLDRFAVSPYRTHLPTTRVL